jgi:PAS domain S-box-containing protein
MALWGKGPVADGHGSVELDWIKVVDSLCEAFLVVAHDGRILFSNRAAGELWHLGQAERENLTISHLVPQGEECARGIIQELMARGKYEADILFQKTSGERFLGAVRGCVLEGEGGDFRMVLSVRDLTEQRKLQEQMLESQKLSYLEKVVEGLSHEIRNPIVSIGGYARRLEKMLEPDHPGRAILQVIMEDVQRMESMLREVEGYLEFAKTHKLSFAKLDLQEVVREALALVPIPKEIRLETHYPQRGPWIYGDRVHLVELFRHLVENAVEAMPKGGLLKLAVKAMADCAKVVVEDTGVGIPEKFLPHIYSPFFTTKTKGAGVGLAKASIIVQEHGGHIQVQSEVAKGTTFEVTFPFDRRRTPRRTG